MSTKTKEYYSKLKKEKFGRLQILFIISNNKHNQKRCVCKCDCGNITKTMLYSVTSGNTRSCGCLHKEMTSKANKTHGMSRCSFYHHWESMKARCNNKNNLKYKDYGGRGIKYDPKWEDFLEFKKDMYFKYLYAKRQLKIKHLSLERKDVNGNYCFENCCFIALKDQGKNTRKNKWFKAISPRGMVYKSKNQRDFAIKHNLYPKNINAVLKKHKKTHFGWRFNYEES